MKLSILVTGGSGYLGQFVIERLAAEGHNVYYVYHANPLPAGAYRAEGIKADLASYNDLDHVFEMHQYHVVINCAAISQPVLCEKDFEATCAINVPQRLVQALQIQQALTGHEALLIHISTDQVYDGARPMWREEDACQPVNAYGRWGAGPPTPRASGTRPPAAPPPPPPPPVTSHPQMAAGRGAGTPPVASGRLLARFRLSRTAQGGHGCRMRGWRMGFDAPPPFLLHPHDCPPPPCRSKLLAEQLIGASWPNHYILRASLIGARPRRQGLPQLCWRAPRQPWAQAPLTHAGAPTPAALLQTCLRAAWRGGKQLRRAGSTGLPTPCRPCDCVQPGHSRGCRSSGRCSCSLWMPRSRRGAPPASSRTSTGGGGAEGVRG